MSIRKNIQGIVSYTVLAVFLVWTLFPLYWLLNTSLKPEGEALSVTPDYVPKHPTLANYRTLFDEFRFGRILLNSTVIATGTALGILAVSTPMGYAFARFRFRGKDSSTLAILITQAFPMAVLIVPLYVMFSRLRLTNNLLSLIIVYSAFFSAFNTLLIRGFFEGVPPELEEAAIIDGCSRFGAFLRISVPLTAPGLAAAGIFAFVGAWNELIFATMFIHSEALQTLPVRLNMMMGEHLIRFAAQSAGTVVSLVPAFAFFMYAQKYLIQGIGAGAIKG